MCREKDRVFKVTYCLSSDQANKTRNAPNS
jgi:hypothetical protein